MATWKHENTKNRPLRKTIQFASRLCRYSPYEKAGKRKHKSSQQEDRTYLRESQKECGRYTRQTVPLNDFVGLADFAVRMPVSLFTSFSILHPCMGGENCRLGPPNKALFICPYVSFLLDIARPFCHARLHQKKKGYYHAVPTHRICRPRR